MGSGTYSTVKGADFSGTKNRASAPKAHTGMGLPQAAVSPPSQGAIKARPEGHLWGCCPGKEQGPDPRFLVQPEAYQREVGLKSSTDPLGDFANDLTSYTSRSRISQV